jgi:hypothetical protein
MPTQQYRVLNRLVQSNGWRHGAEIGVLRGKTLFALLDANPSLAMFAIDQWKQLPPRPNENAETYNDYDMNGLCASVTQKAKTYHGRCQILKGDSEEMAAMVENGTLDFVFIDGDHTEAGVARDIRAWAPKVKEGGMVLGHDWPWPTVRRVIDRLCPGWVDYGESVWGIAKAQI